jgi:3-methyladenine DNA glycosylase AlkD
MSAPEKILKDLRRLYRREADPARAVEMRAYMKSEMPYHGVPSPVSKKLCREYFRTLEIGDASEWRTLVLYLWRNAKFREERYATLQLCGHKKSLPFQDMQALKVYEEMIVDGAWWDYVDDIASHRLGHLLARHPQPMKTKMRQWSRSANLWKRRSSILCQLGFGRSTDLELLFACIEASMDSKEFFLQKAIGWALRQYAWKDPGLVQAYVKKKADRLSNLSRREALKNVSKL